MNVIDALPVKHGRNALDLAFECVELAGTVPAVHEQQFAPADDPDGAELDLAAAALGVDHGDAARPDRDVVDVRASTAWDSPVVEYDDVGAA